MGEFHDDLTAAIERIRKAAVENGRRVGIYCAGGEAAKKYKDQGFHMVGSGQLLTHWDANMILLQISVVADVVALPTFLSNSLATAQK